MIYGWLLPIYQKKLRVDGDLELKMAHAFKRALRPDLKKLLYR